MKFKIDLSKHPRFEVNVQNRLKVFAGLSGLFLTFYFFTNRVQFFEPHVFNTMNIENLIPFWPWTAIFYVSDYFFPFIVGFILRDRLTLTRVSFGYLIMTFICTLSFLFFPVRYPRELFPLPDGGGWILDLVRMLDTPANCFPSAHVAIIWLTNFALYRERPKLGMWFSIWGFLICVSTLTTKQHYTVDVLAGIVVGMFSYLLAERCLVLFSGEIRDSAHLG